MIDALVTYADLAYHGAGPHVTVPVRRRPRRLSPWGRLHPRCSTSGLVSKAGTLPSTNQGELTWMEEPSAPPTEVDRLRLRGADALVQMYLSGDGSTDGLLADIADLDARLDALHERWRDRKHPLFATVEFGDMEAESRSLAIVVGRAWSAVTYQIGVDHSFWLWESAGDAALVPAADHDNGEVTLVAARDVSGDEVFTYRLTSHAVPIAVARAAVREFFLTTLRPRCLTWREN